MIHIHFEYRCDFCGKEIVGADVHEHGADYGRFPVPRHVSKVGPAHACNTCLARAQDAAKVPA